MEILSLHNDIQVDDTNTLRVIYKMTEEDAQFGVKCYIAGADESERKNYCHVSNVSGNESVVEKILYHLAKSCALPIHINDIITDCFI